MNNLKVGILILIVLALVILGVWYVYQKQALRIGQTSQITFEAASSPTPSPTGKFNPSPKPKQTLGTQPATGVDLIEAGQEGINIDWPQESTLISSPVKVTGAANVIEEKVIIVVKNSDGETLGFGEAQACLLYEPCPFEAEIGFDQPQTETGFIDVYNPAPHGSAKYLQSVPVRFK